MTQTRFDLDLTGKTPLEVADIIKDWQEDEAAMMDAAFDLLNSLEPWLRHDDLVRIQRANQ